MIWRFSEVPSFIVAVKLGKTRLTLNEAISKWSYFSLLIGFLLGKHRKTRSNRVNWTIRYSSPIAGIGNLSMNQSINSRKAEKGAAKQKKSNSKWIEADRPVCQRQRPDPILHWSIASLCLCSAIDDAREMVFRWPFFLSLLFLLRHQRSALVDWGRQLSDSIQQVALTAGLRVCPNFFDLRKSHVLRYWFDYLRLSMYVSS